ncbi:MAG: multiheme c-type cytochrome [Planctomycetota bacterium]
MNIEAAWLGARAAAVLVLASPASAAAPQAIGLEELSEASQDCIACHKKETYALTQQWGESQHYRANVGCYECHRADPSDPDVWLHFDYLMATIVSPKDCGRCHIQETEEFLGSRHSTAGRIDGSLESLLADVVEGNHGFVTMGFPEGSSAAAVSGCWQCHGAVVKLLPDHRLDPATWPNAGIGRFNPDGTEGSCSACHARHTFSVAQARHPAACGKCHLGPDHPQREVYESSKHGMVFYANVDHMNLSSNKWVVGEDYHAAPTCATCHMSATPRRPVTHDVGVRISWNNRRVLSIRPELADEAMNLPGKDLSWQMRRANMKDVCINCHNKIWVENFYVQYDAIVELYNEKYAQPGLALMELAKPLMNPVSFSNPVDWIWFELWHHEGRRARHGASMMGPDYTHWHGTYELAKSFYMHLLPELQHVAETGIAAGGDQAAAGAALRAKIAEILAGQDHRWFLGKMDPAEAARRAQAAAEFEARSGQ